MAVRCCNGRAVLQWRRHRVPIRSSCGSWTIGEPRNGGRPERKAPSGVVVVSRRQQVLGRVAAPSCGRRAVRWADACVASEEVQLGGTTVEATLKSFCRAKSAACNAVCPQSLASAERDFASIAGSCASSVRAHIEVRRPLEWAANGADWLPWGPSESEQEREPAGFPVVICFVRRFLSCHASSALASLVPCLRCARLRYRTADGDACDVVAVDARSPRGPVGLATVLSAPDIGLRVPLKIFD